MSCKMTCTWKSTPKNRYMHACDKFFPTIISFWLSRQPEQWKILLYNLNERCSIRWYWVLGIRYWCLLELNANFTYLHMVNNKYRKKILYTSTWYLIPNTSSIDFDSIGVIISKFCGKIFGIFLFQIDKNYGRHSYSNSNFLFLNNLFVPYISGTVYAQ